MGFKSKLKKLGKVITTPVRKPAKFVARPFRAKWQRKQHAKAIAQVIS